MDNKRKAQLCAVLAAPFPAFSAVAAANDAYRPIFVILPLVIMAVLLFLCGYYAGLSRCDD